MSGCARCKNTGYIDVIFYASWMDVEGRASKLVMCPNCLGTGNELSESDERRAHYNRVLFGQFGIQDTLYRHIHPTKSDIERCSTTPGGKLMPELIALHVVVRPPSEDPPVGTWSLSPEASVST